MTIEHDSQYRTFHSLKNNFLIAMPNLQDPYFSHSVVYICEHDEHGAMGLVINKPASINFGEVLDSMGVTCKNMTIRGHIVSQGGPIQIKHGWVIYRPVDSWEANMQPSEDIGITYSENVLTALSEGEGPQEYLVCFGYAGWQEGQLEEELQSNSWLIAPYNAELIFSVPVEQRWHVAAASIGVDPTYLSRQVGHA